MQVMKGARTLEVRAKTDTEELLRSVSQADTWPDDRMHQC